MLFSFPVLVPESTPHNNAKLMWAVGAWMYRMATEMARKWIFNDAHCCEFCLPLLLPVSCGNGMFLSSLRPKPALLSSPPLSPKPCTPHPVSGGDQLCQSRQTTHTHTQCWLANKATGTANKGEPCLRASPLLSLRCCEGKAWHHCHRLSVSGRHCCWEEERLVFGLWWNILVSSSVDELRCWRSAERIAGRENQTWVLSSFPQRPGVCLLFTGKSLTLVDIVCLLMLLI